MIAFGKWMIWCEEWYRYGIETNDGSNILNTKIVFFFLINSPNQLCDKTEILHLAIMLSIIPMPTRNSKNFLKCDVSFEKLAKIVNFSRTFPW